MAIPAEVYQQRRKSPQKAFTQRAKKRRLWRMKHNYRDEQTILEEILIQQKKIASYLRCFLIIWFASVAITIFFALLLPAPK
ncbi:MAG: hypothetical protein IKW49_02975 [Opitutales bacterium]|nr:hypothetical protein [Opitutales bacterium]